MTWFGILEPKVVFFAFFRDIRLYWNDTFSLFLYPKISQKNADYRCSTTTLILRKEIHLIITCMLLDFHSDNTREEKFQFVFVKSFLDSTGNHKTLFLSDSL